MATTLDCVCSAQAADGGAPACPADADAFMRAACDDPAIDWVARIAAPEHDEVHVGAQGRQDTYFYARDGRLVGAVVRDELTCRDGTRSPGLLGGGYTPLPDGRERTCSDSCFRREAQLLPHPCSAPDGSF